MTSKVHVREFKSLADFLDLCESPTDFPASRRSSLSGDSSFTGTATFDEAIDLAFGWKKGADRIEKMAARIKPRNQKNRFEAKAREAGPGVVSMGAFNAGHPQPYVVLEESNAVKAGRGKIVKVVVNISASAGVNKSTIERRGAAILSLVSALEKAGRRVEVEVVEATGAGWNRNSKELLVYRVSVKKPQQKLNLYSIAFAIAHPSMLRRFIFSAMEHESDALRRKFGVGSGYGMPADIPAESRGDIYLGAMKGWDSVWESDTAAEGWVKAQAEAQGVRF